MVDVQNWGKDSKETATCAAPKGTREKNAHFTTREKEMVRKEDP